MNQQHSAIVVFQSNGVVGHHFCDTENAKRTVDNPDCFGWSAFLFQGVSAEDVYSISPQLREKVEFAKTKLCEQLRIQYALDKHGVPPELEVRHAVHEAFSELRFEAVRAELARIGGYADADQAAMSNEMRISQAVTGCNIPLDARMQQAVKASFQELLAN